MRCTVVEHAMAFLNLRDRTLEISIAYLGARGSGKSTNVAALERLRGTWSQRRFIELDDCEVAVSIGDSEGDDLSLLSRADAVVLVLDSSAVSPSRRMVRSLQGVPKPVIAQINKHDLEPAAAFDLGTWPVTFATASRGEGVIETFEQAVQGALRMAMESDRPKEATEENPLLTALRSAIAAAVATEVAAMEQRLAGELRAVAESNEAILAELRKSKKSWFG